MATFYYQATDRTGKLIEGDIEAQDQRVAVQKVRTLNYLPIRVSEKQPPRALPFTFKLPQFAARVSSKELLTLTQQLATLVSSGTPLDKSLSILVSLTEKKSSKSMLQEVYNRVHGGSTMADALAQHPHAFSRLYVNMVRAGEAGGVLGPVLLRLAAFLEKSDELKSNIRSAMIYPCLLVLVGGGAVAVLMTVVIPKFANIFGDMGRALPLPTLFLLKTSEIFAQYWWAFLLALAAAAAAFKYMLKNEKSRHWWDSLILRLPLFGALTQKIEVSRFSLTMSTLLNSGVPILQALLIVRSILSNSVIGAAMEKLHSGLKGGKGISGPLQQLAVFPPMAVHMITVGEETGALEDMLAKISETYDKEVERAIKNLISLIEPLMILLMGAIVGFIVISMLMAIFSINDVPL